MFLFAHVFTLRQVLRAFSSTSVATAKTGHFLHKLIAKSKTRTPNLYACTPHDSAVPSALRKPQEITQRQKVLNAVFMENVSNIMFVGEIGERLQGYGIELTEVRVSADCTHLNVYWVTSLNLPGIQEKISKLLLSCCGLLRSELISCVFMGRVPRITFVHDASYLRARDMEQVINRVSLEIQQQEQECSHLDFRWILRPKEVLPSTGDSKGK
ncbi:ribosome-binding factor A-like isoform X2 [Ornithodoros turicata]|uniref:ribosome-binding factor A-like isoform X2 n=1 Tax=Ornithodoros turicata TaxID=34597 RepID=UPI00313A231C